MPLRAASGAFLIGTLILAMNYNHPYSEMSRQYFVTTPIAPNVSGQVIEVPVEPNQLLEVGDVLSKLDPVPFRNKYDSVKARLDAAKSELAREQQLFKVKAATKRELDWAVADFEDLTAQLEQA